MRVLFMQSQAFFGADSGIQALLMRHFDRRDVDVHVACTPVELRLAAVSTPTRVREIPHVAIRWTEFGPSLTDLRERPTARDLGRAVAAPFSILGLATYLRRNRIDIIHGTEKPRDAMFAVLLGRLTGAKSVVHVHVGYARWFSPGVRWALREADAVVGVSRFVAETLVRAGLRSERVHAVVNALDATRWDPATDGAAVRAALGLPAGAVVIGTVGRLFKWKGQADLVTAFADVARERPHVRLVIVGEDDRRAHPGGGSHRAELDAIVRSRGLEDRVIFTGFRPDVAALLAAFDVYAMPSWEEPCAIAYLEAMAMRKPVVAWANGGTPELVRDGETGILCTPGSLTELSTALLRLIDDGDLRRRFGDAGRRHVIDDLSPEQMCRSMIEVYRRALTTRVEPRGLPESAEQPR